MDVNELKTTDQVAAILRVKPKRVRDYIRDGELLSAKMGGAWLTPIEEIEAMIQRKLTKRSNAA